MDPTRPETESTQGKASYYATHVIVLSAQALFALVQLLQRATDLQGEGLSGSPAAPILLASIPLGLMIFGIRLGLLLRTGGTRFHRLDSSLHRVFNGPAANLVHLVSALILLTGLYLLASLRANSLFVLAPPYDTYFLDLVFDRTKNSIQLFAPLIGLATGLAAQVIVFVFGIQADFRTWQQRFKAQAFSSILLVFGVLLILWGLLSRWSQSLEPDLVGYSWYPVGAPVMDSDVLAAFLIGISLIGLSIAGKAIGLGRYIGSALVTERRKRIFDIAISALLWITAGVLWLSLPMEPNWFLTEAAHPNYEYYPQSDALKYDIAAQNMLLGENLLYYGFLMHKPLYAAFLALLHSLAGPDFEGVSLLQAAIFGVFPVLVYFFTTRLHGRLAGIIASFLVIFREVNAILSTSQITISHSRQLLTDVPATIGILLVIYTLYVWIQKPNTYFWFPVMFGALIASLMQVRNELLILLPLVLAFQALFYIRLPRYWIKVAGLIVVGFTMIFVLWQARAMYFSGESFLNSSRVTGAIQDVEIRAFELDPEPIQEEGNRVLQSLSHLVHNLQQAFLIFPSVFRQADTLISFAIHQDTDKFWQDCCSTENYLERLRPFWAWKKWDGTVPAESQPLILSTLFLISLGIVRSKERSGYRALFPLVVVFAFYFMYSSFRMSGGRHGQLVDWIWIVYYSIGLAQVAEWLWYFLFSSKAPAWLMGRKEDRESDPGQENALPDPDGPGWKPLLSSSLIVFLLGAMPLFVELVIPAQFTNKTRQANIEAALEQANSEVVAEFLEQGGTVWEGRAFYPRYFRASHIERDLGQLFVDNGYVLFSLAGANSLPVFLPTEQRAGFALSNSADVLVFGCQYGYIFDALAVYDSKESRLILRDPLPETPMCPLTTGN